MNDIENFKKEFLDNLKLSDIDLGKACGGVKTGDFDSNGEVYIAFPGMVSFLSGYYNTNEIEELAITYSSYKTTIRAFATSDVKNAVKTLYEKEEKPIPSTVSDFLGL